MKQFQKCPTCRHIYNDDYCLYCIHHYNLSVLSPKHQKDLRNYYLEDKNQNLYGDLENVYNNNN